MREKEGFPLLEKLPEEPSPKLAPLPKSFDPYRREVFLLEIGSEELPATFVPIGMENLERDLRALFKELGLQFESLHLFGTPRRLGALVHGLVEGTADEEVERRGPAVQNAFDAEGNPTKQGLGFLKSLGLEGIKRQDLGHAKGLEVRGDYLYAKIQKEGKSVDALLSERLPKLILDLDFPKKMRWAALDIAYPRPIQWIACMYGNRVIPFAVGAVGTSAYSFGHAQLDPKKIILKEAKDYFAQLKAHHVLADVSERKQIIDEQLRALEKEHKVQVLKEKRVLSEVLHLSEWPMLMVADFDPAFLKAPPEVLISEMVEHQRYFPLQDAKGDLAPQFIITADNTPNALIKSGNEKVLSARLADGVFLYEQDLKVPLESFNEMLAKVTFQKELGSTLDKVLRVTKLAEELNEVLTLADTKKVARAALLCKADLASDMVGEFPELQGTIGKYFALYHKEDPEVALAIEEHWMPRVEGGALPSTATGMIVSLADKLDNLISYFHVGLKPTSSSDPYALRRQAIGILKILIENRLSLSLDTFVGEEVLNYLTSRAKGVYEDFGFAKDEIEASLRGLCHDPYDQFCKVRALHAFRKGESFAGLFEVYKRAKGQLEKEKPGIFDPALASEPAEKELLAALVKLEKSWKTLLSQKEYAKAFEEMATLKDPLAHLFDTVKILADDPQVRQNRLALLHRIFAHFEELLDFSCIQIKN
jgi:glycyl-tRNA synthetase